MNITVSNQKPIILQTNALDTLPIVDPTLPADAFFEMIMADVKRRYVDPVYEPSNPNQPVVVADETNPQQIIPISEDALIGGIRYIWSNPVLDVLLHSQVGEIYRKALQYTVPNDWHFEEQLVVESLTRLRLPLPQSKGSKITSYTASMDVLPAAKGLFLHPDEATARSWFANISAYIHDRNKSNFALVTIRTTQDFKDFIDHLKNIVASLQKTQILGQPVNKALSDFYKINLTKELSAGLFLPDGGLSRAPEHAPLSFSRILMHAFATFEKAGKPGTLTVQPSNLQHVYFPENIVLLNLENYANADPTDIRKDWDVIEKALDAKQKLNIISNKNLLTAKTVARSTDMAQTSVNPNSMMNDKSPTRALDAPFTGKPVPSADMLAAMVNIIQSQITMKETQNSYKVTKNTFMRPNRRRPDDANAQGKLTKKQYRPDLHLYLDTSGSISESQYRDAVTNAILLAKKLDSNVFITSFSDYISETSMLLTKGLSLTEIYKNFLAIPKVTGGTDFENVWRKIEMIDEQNARTNQSFQVNFVVTDFAYSLNSNRRWTAKQASVQNTYYVPVSTNQSTWRHILGYAKSFKEQMQHAGDATIRQRMLI